MSVFSLVSSGPLILAVPIAAAAGAVTFLSPCCLPLVPGYLSYVTGMAGVGAQPASSAARSASAARQRPPVGARLSPDGPAAVPRTWPRPRR